MTRVIKAVLVSSALLCAGCASWRTGAESLETKIAVAHRMLVSDRWGGGHRMIFDFGGRRAWIVEPDSPGAGRPWVWTMQWMGAFLERTGAPALVEKGFYHVHLEAFDTRANDDGLKALADFHDYLVRELGFAPKANLIGMSWGGFYSIRYASTFPDRVAKIYLDAPLLDLEKFMNGAGYTPTEGAKRVGPWAELKSEGGSWSTDPRMPVNRAEPVARAGIPIILLYGGQDQTVDPKTNSELFAERFKVAGGKIDIRKRDGYGHHPHGFEHEDIAQIIGFFE